MRRNVRRSARRRAQPADGQLDLISSPPEGGWWRCHGLFTPSYIRQHLLPRDDVPSEEDVRRLYEFVKEQWVQKLPAMRRRREPFTRTEFLDPMLHELGWEFIPEESLPDTQTRKIPDYCLFGDAQIKDRVAAGSGTEIFRAAHTALEAKKVQHPLDQVSDEETPGWFPSDQVQDYLRRARDDTGRRFFNWAMLSNGNEWRLYCENAGPSAYFSFHIAHGPEFCSLEDFRLFVALFRPSSFTRDPEGRCLLDELRSQSLTAQVQLEENLRKRVFDVLVELAEGFFLYPDNGLTDADLPQVYATSLVYLYRLLFILYAESRGLLPTKRSGAGSRTRYLDEYSLTRLIPKLRDRAAYDEAELDDLYQELHKLFHLINGTESRRNRAIGVTQYNGGLFDPSLHPTIEDWRVGDRTLADVLRQLIFRQPPARGRSRQLTISTDETIDYSTLEVRQLGDIYEGLLGGRLRVAGQGQLELVNERGENQRGGIFYTPDWIVLFLRNNALQPLIDEIEQMEAVRTAAASDTRDNCFADAVLRLKVVDPAMGSGHFLVRATEWLAEQVVRHPTTRRETEQIVAAGDSRRARGEVVADGHIPVPPGIPQEQAEVAYWRRRLVESCIYGVDSNPLAVELAKLSLWLTCIAADQPLNFLDHHLRCGNSLLFARPDEIAQLPASQSEESAQLRSTVIHDLQAVLARVIHETGRIAAEPSTQLEVVKGKQKRWQQVHRQLDPFIGVADLWLAALDGVAIQPEDYRLLVLNAVRPAALSGPEKRQAGKLAKSLVSALQDKTQALQAFHWHLEFPEVFFQSDGSLLPQGRSGFDCILGNPPYISTHTSSEEGWRSALERRAGYLEDLYVHFTDIGFQLLRANGTFGFIVSDTFFTLAGKLRMRQQLQKNRLLALGQCDPFKATVDAAIFVARKQPVADREKLLFIQARYGTQASKPDKELPDLSLWQTPPAESRPDVCDVDHLSKGCLRLHWAPIGLYREALKQAFFEPRPAVLALYRRFNAPTKRLVEQWWSSIETSEKYANNSERISKYQAGLKPGNTTLVGLVAEGGQGMRTANNSRFLGYLAGTPKASAIEAKREQWTRRWLEHPGIGPAFVELLRENGSDPAHATANMPAWEACVEPLKSEFTSGELGFGRTDLYRVVPPALVAGDDDFRYTWQRRKAELLRLWQAHPDLAEFWKTPGLLDTGHHSSAPLRTASDVTDEEFCVLYRELMLWRVMENDRRRRIRPRRPNLLPVDFGLRNGEVYSNPSDAPRIAVTYNGLRGRGQWVAFRKGDPEGNRWVDDEPLYINWSPESVGWLASAPEARWQGQRFFFTPGVAYTLMGNHVPLKAKLQEPCVFDAGASRFMPTMAGLGPFVLLGVLNSAVFSFHLKKFLKNTQDFEISDLRMMPLVVPSAGQAARLEGLAQRAVEAKRLTFTNDLPSHDLVAFCRQTGDELVAQAPEYLHPDAQLRLLATAQSCLDVIELTVNWEAEKLYGVEGLGPFDEF